MTASERDRSPAGLSAGERRDHAIVTVDINDGMVAAAEGEQEEFGRITDEGYLIGATAQYDPPRAVGALSNHPDSGPSVGGPAEHLKRSPKRPLHPVVELGSAPTRPGPSNILMMDEELDQVRGVIDQAETGWMPPWWTVTECPHQVREGITAHRGSFRHRRHTMQ